MTQSSQIDSPSMNFQAHTDIADILYEFRTALDTVLMSVELLSQEESFGAPIDRKYYLQHIRGAVGKMSQLLSENEPKVPEKTPSNPWISPASHSYQKSRAASSQPHPSSRT